MFKKSRLGNYPNSFFGDVCVMKSKTLTHYKGIFSFFKSVLWLVMSFLCFD